MLEDAVVHIYIHQSKYGYHVIVDRDGQLTAEGMDTLPEALEFLEKTATKLLARKKLS